jgi:hypothetical protein
MRKKITNIILGVFSAIFFLTAVWMFFIGNQILFLTNFILGLCLMFFAVTGESVENEN